MRRRSLLRGIRDGKSHASNSQSSDGDEGISPKSSGRETEDVDEWEEVAEVALTSEFPLETTGRRGSLMAHIIMEFININREINVGSAEFWRAARRREEDGRRGQEAVWGGRADETLAKTWRRSVLRRSGL
jgi:hypothetical protein